MKISLAQVGKRFQRHWIFREVTYDFEAGAYALLGPNGCGKSTLLRIIATMQAPSLGKVHYYNGRPGALSPESIFSHTAYCAPGMDVVEEMTLREFFTFHFSFKKLLPGLAIDEVIAQTGLPDSAGKTIGDYSSGMKQRVKLAQAIFADTPVLLLDEPCTNLDQKGVEQYHNWITQYAGNRLVIVASNDEREYFFCKERIEIEKYK